MAFLLAALVMAANGPEVGLLCASGGEGDFAELRFQTVGSTTLAPPVARFTIVPRSTVTGVLVPKSRVVVAVACTTAAADETWAFSLVRLEAGVPAKQLVDHVAAASTPVVTADGRVFVERGSAGRADGSQWRVDELRIDEVNVSTGATRTVVSGLGYFATLAGTLGRELVVYRVDPSGARLEAVNIDSREVRLLRAAMPATAHDFTVDSVRGALLYTVGNPTTHLWNIERLDLKTLGVTTLTTGPTVALLPTVFPDGRIAFAPRAGAGLRDTSVTAEAVKPMISAQGPGFERVRFFSQGFAIGLHEIPSDFPVPFAVSLADGSPSTLLAPSEMRLEIAGVVQ